MIKNKSVWGLCLLLLISLYLTPIFADDADLEPNEWGYYDLDNGRVLNSENYKLYMTTGVTIGGEFMKYDPERALSSKQMEGLTREEIIELANKGINPDDFTQEEKAYGLNAIGRFLGKNTEYWFPALSSPADAYQAIVMTERIINTDEKLEKLHVRTREFADVPTWAKAEAEHCVRLKITDGVGPNEFGSYIDQKRVVVWLLRGLGEDPVKAWTNTRELADKRGIRYKENTKGLTRGELVDICVDAMKDDIERPQFTEAVERLRKEKAEVAKKFENKDYAEAWNLEKDYIETNVLGHNGNAYAQYTREELYEMSIRDYMRVYEKFLDKYFGTEYWVQPDLSRRINTRVAWGYTLYNEAIKTYNPDLAAVKKAWEDDGFFVKERPADGKLSMPLGADTWMYELAEGEDFKTINYDKSSPGIFWNMPYEFISFYKDIMAHSTSRKVPHPHLDGNYLTQYPVEYKEGKVHRIVGKKVVPVCYVNSYTKPYTLYLCTNEEGTAFLVNTDSGGGPVGFSVYNDGSKWTTGEDSPKDKLYPVNGKGVNGKWHEEFEGLRAVSPIDHYINLKSEYR